MPSPAFRRDERVVDRQGARSRSGEHLVGKVFFANYQNLDEELDGKKVYEHFDAGLLRSRRGRRVPPFRLRRLVRRARAFRLGAISSA